MCPVYKLPWLPKNLEVAIKAKKKMASDQLKNYVLQVFRILLLSWPLPSLHGLKKSPEFISRTLDIARKIYEKKIFVQNPVGWIWNSYVIKCLTENFLC